jgi:hypothetical protein
VIVLMSVVSVVVLPCCGGGFLSSVLMSLMHTPAHSTGWACSCCCRRCGCRAFSVVVVVCVCVCVCACVCDVMFLCRCLLLFRSPPMKLGV